jgi:putative ABC transport system permease protein
MDAIGLQGKNDVYFENTEDLISAGRMISPVDTENESRVALIGQGIADELFVGSNPVGESIKIDGITFTVIGVLNGSDSFASSSTDEAVMIPYTTALNMVGAKYINNLTIYLTDDNQADLTTRQIEAVLDKAFNGDG